MTERKLASVRRVAEIVPIEGADKIVVAKIDGWQVVTQKDWCKPGDLVCHFEIDSFLSVRPEYEFLRKSGYKNTKNLGEGFRLKTIKLRGQLSQGLIMPLEEVIDGVCKHCMADKEWPSKIGSAQSRVCCNCIRFEDVFGEGTDLTQFLGVKLYERPIPVQLAGKVRGNFPAWIHKTDQERAQNLFKRLKEAWDGGECFEVTLKLDGSSMTLYSKGGYVGVCSRNWDLEEEKEAEGRGNSFWKCARDEGLIEKLEQIGMDYDFALQGELMGPGVQDNREKLPTLQFFLFDVWDISAQAYLPAFKRTALAKNYDIQHVPILDSHLNIRNVVHSPETMIKDLLAFADCKSLNNSVAEGLVFKSISEDFSFKIVNNKFLLEEKD